MNCRHYEIVVIELHFFGKHMKNERTSCVHFTTPTTFRPLNSVAAVKHACITPTFTIPHLGKIANAMKQPAIKYCIFERGE